MLAGAEVRVPEITFEGRFLFAGSVPRVAKPTVGCDGVALWALANPGFINCIDAAKRINVRVYRQELFAGAIASVPRRSD